MDFRQFSHIHPPSPSYQTVYDCVDNMADTTRRKSNYFNFSVESLYSQLHAEGFLVLESQDILISTYSVNQALSNASCDIFANEFLDQLFTKDRTIGVFLSSLLNFYCVDEVNYFVNSSLQNVGSDFWHRDGVGHRLKLFLPIKIIGQPPTTDIFPKSHLNSCRPFNWEMLRVGIDTPSNHTHQHLLEGHFAHNFSKFFSFAWSPQKFLLLDTNAIHRAANFHSGTPGSSRSFLIIEFMDPTASRIAHRYRLGECGMKRNKDLISLFTSRLRNQC